VHRQMRHLLPLSLLDFVLLQVLCVLALFVLVYLIFVILFQLIMVVLMGLHVLSASDYFAFLSVCVVVVAIINLMLTLYKAPLDTHTVNIQILEVVELIHLRCRHIRSGLIVDFDRFPHCLL
jgi:hypothetical protein